MKFCQECDNMLYIKINPDSNGIHYYCKYCSYTLDKQSDIEDYCIYTSHSTHQINNFKAIINKYTTQDPTLPRVNNIKCPNPECLSNTDDEKTNEVIYIKYDQQNMKYLYVCCCCQQAWRTVGVDKTVMVEI